VASSARVVWVVWVACIVVLLVRFRKAKTGPERMRWHGALFSPMLYLSQPGGVVQRSTELSKSQQLEALEALLEIARDLTSSLAARDRYGRLLGAVRRILPCDAACLLRLEGTELVPLAAYGLTEEATHRRYDVRQHPRLDVILR